MREAILTTLAELSQFALPPEGRDQQRDHVKSSPPFFDFKHTGQQDPRKPQTKRILLQSQHTLLPVENGNAPMGATIE